MVEFNIEPMEKLLQDTPWELYMDDSTENRSRVGIDLISPNQHLFCEALPFNFKTSNDRAEYEALITEVSMDKKLKITCLVVL